LRKGAGLRIRICSNGMSTIVREIEIRHRKVLKNKIK
jgi:hypothetical protein